MRRPVDMSRSGPIVRAQMQGKTATLYADGVETLTDANGTVVRHGFLPGGVLANGPSAATTTADTYELFKPVLTPKHPLPFAPNELVVVFADGVAPTQDTITLRGPALAGVQSYTPSYAVNRALASLGADSLTRIASAKPRGTVSYLHRFALSSGRGGSLDLANAFRVHITNAPLGSALTTLRKTPGILYASRNWYVAPMRVPGMHLTTAAVADGQNRARQIASAPRPTAFSLTPHAIPSNYAVAASAQSLLNTPGVNAVAAYDEIERQFHQLPGQGELIANVSLGDVNDSVQNNACRYPTGGTAHLIGGQHYIDWPSMPLIPAYVVDSTGLASGSAESCGIDPTLGEVGLDFSMMAPLPHELQRGGAQGTSYADLQGIAPGASYELFVPQTASGKQSDILQTLLAAATSQPRPDVITMSLGFGVDQYGFPSRYLEEDPLTQAAVAGIVGSGIVVCISGGDGTRLYTPAAIGPDGGSAATNVVPAGSPITDLNDIEFTTEPSSVVDSGAIDVGGSTLDDIAAAPPWDPANAALAAQQAWAETRWTGFAQYSSGYGTRVNLSAPSDNVLALAHNYDGGTFFDYNSVNVSLQGGTSAAAPEVAAAAAVVMQVAKLTGHPFANPLAVRTFLTQTARALPNVPQADVTVNVGPQIDLGNAVETLLHQAGTQVAFAAPRVAIAQRREQGAYGTDFVTDTAPS
ncbi:MAG: S8 family serine peptidase, partial [Candidatus Eremiobacteraeota bacterium]|nr:S8 family serine peptidase [Candidatus Eremiobacteraeota bacterium]